MLGEKDGGNIPEFRGIALEEQFCKHFTEICRLFKEFGNLEDHYDIPQTINTLKLENNRWHEVVPFEHYLTPLKMALKKVRDELLRMKKAGPLLNKYIIEKNEDLMAFTVAMVK